jgi:hypothetical protein
MLACHMRYRGMDAIFQGMDFGLPQHLLTMVRTCKPLLELMATIGKNHKPEYDDGDDEPAYSTTASNSADGKVGLGDGGSSSSVSDNHLKLFESAFEERAASYKKQKSADSSSINIQSEAGIQLVAVLPVRVYNKDLKIYPGAFFGLLPDKRLGSSRKYASVTECFTHEVNGKAYVRLRIYQKHPTIPKRNNVHETVRSLGLPLLTPTDTYTFRSAAELKYPLHVLHACPKEGMKDSCTKKFGFGDQQRTDHNAAQYQQYVLNTYHLGTVNF